MIMKVDLHNHTNYSDGYYSPKEVVAAAIKNGVDCFAITDHDSVFGCDEIQEAAKDTKVKVINGMELSTEYKGKSVHLVCLFKNNIIPQKLVEFSYKMLEQRKERAIKMMSLVEKYYGLKIDIDLLISESKILTRGNMAVHLAKMNNLPLEEAHKYVSFSSKAYIPSTKLPTKEGLDFVKECGCLVILAHPCLLPKEYVEEICTFGLDGIEVKYPKNKVGDEEYFRALAQKYHLFVSAGSDFHGDTLKHAMIGTCTLDAQEFAIIKERLNLQW